jgi:hypothetical protein
VVLAASLNPADIAVAAADALWTRLLPMGGEVSLMAGCGGQAGPGEAASPAVAERSGGLKLKRAQAGRTRQPTRPGTLEIP